MFERVLAQQLNQNGGCQTASSYGGTLFFFFSLPPPTAYPRSENSSSRFGESDRDKYQSVLIPPRSKKR